jgi:hypothetical protein
MTQRVFTAYAKNRPNWPRKTTKKCKKSGTNFTKPADLDDQTIQNGVLTPQTQ